MAGAPTAPIRGGLREPGPTACLGFSLVAMAEEARTMRHAKPHAQASGPFLKTALVLWSLALCGVFLVLPYVATLENKALAAAAARAHLGVWELLAFSVLQAALLLALAVLVGQWAAWKLGLGVPLIVALLTGRPAPENTLPTLLMAFALGIVTALALTLLDRWVFAPIPSVAELIRNAETGSAKPSAWQGFLASFLAPWMRKS